MTDPAARRTLDRYRSAPRGVRLHVAVRWRSCPMAATADLVPAGGDVLEIGCGHGLFSCYLVERDPRRRVVGVDIDPRKVEAASAAAAGGSWPEGTTPPRFELTMPGELPPGPFDTVVIVDVLYLLDDEQKDGLLTAAASRLRPGGTLVVKEVASTPRWKARVAAAQERLSTGILGITAGSHHGFDTPERAAGRLGGVGLVEVEVTRLDRRRLHPHVALTARRPGATT